MIERQIPFEIFRNLKGINWSEEISTYALFLIRNFVRDLTFSTNTSLICLLPLIEEIYSFGENKRNIVKESCKTYLKLIFIYHENDLLLEQILMNSVFFVGSIIRSNTATDPMEDKILYYVLQICCIFSSGNSNCLNVGKKIMFIVINGFIDTSGFGIFGFY